MLFIDLQQQQPTDNFSFSLLRNATLVNAHAHAHTIEKQIKSHDGRKTPLPPPYLFSLPLHLRNDYKKKLQKQLIRNPFAKQTNKPTNKFTKFTHLLVNYN